MACGGRATPERAAGRCGGGWRSAGCAAEGRKGRVGVPPGPRGGHSSKEWGVSEASGSGWLSCSDIRLSWPGGRPCPPRQPPLLNSRAWSPGETGPLAPPSPEADDTGTLTDRASMWSGKLRCQSVVLRRGQGEMGGGEGSERLAV